MDIAAPDLCPRYCASLVRGVTIAPSPQWMQERLKSYGMRPINNVVDITNYVMLEYGQPLHAFDYDKLKGQRIIVRCAVEGERMTSLDEVERELNEGILVIADEKEPVAIAGIMGGLDTEVTGKTTTILLEAANFDRATIRRGARHFQLPSEASIRFEKGLSRELPPVALKRATRLFQELAGGRAVKGVIDVYPGRGEAQGVLISTAEVKRLAGMEVEVDEIRRVLASLGFECSQNVITSEANGSPKNSQNFLGKKQSPQISVTAPYWRSDITGDADLVEEVVRLIGYDRVPVTRLSAALPPQEPSPRLRLREKIREIMVGLGFQEVLTYSLVSLEKIERACGERETEPLKVANPMSREQEYLRPDLRPGLLTALAQNQKSEPGGIRLFEMGKAFLPRHPSVIATLNEVKGKQSPEHGTELPQEKEMLCAVLSGPRASLSWRGEKGELDFYDAKGVVEALLGGLSITAEFKPASDRSLSPCAEVVVGGDRLGVLGVLHPGVAEGFELSGTVCLVELDAEKLLSRPVEEKRYAPVYRFPAVSRDIALVVDEEVGYQTVESIIKSFPLVTAVTLFDLYRGEQIARGKKSFAIRIVYQSPEHTLTDEEVNEIQQKMVDRLSRELGGKLRS